MNRFYAVIVVLAIAGVAFWASTFTVDERERAIKLELGEVVNADYEPGLHFKIPFYQTVRKFDDRVLTMDSSPDRMLTVEQKNLVVDAFMKWEIIDSVAFFNATGGDEDRARGRLHEYVRNQLYDELGKRTILEIVSDERAAIMNEVQEVVDGLADQLGVNVVDVRVKRIELPEEVRNSVYQRMETERGAVASRYRSEGRERAQELRAEAEREVEEILARAYREAESIRGEGDARAANIYAQAYNRDSEFYSFYRSLIAYRESFSEGRDSMVLEPESEFFRYFRNSQGREDGDTGDSGQGDQAPSPSMPANP
jgi:membrane protease subunit HflC